MYELLKSVQSEIDTAFSDWYDECDSFLTLLFSSLFDLSFIGGRSDV